MAISFTALRIAGHAAAEQLYSDMLTDPAFRLDPLAIEEVADVLGMACADILAGDDLGALGEWRQAHSKAGTFAFFFLDPLSADFEPAAELALILAAHRWQELTGQRLQVYNKGDFRNVN